MLTPSNPLLVTLYIFVCPNVCLDVPLDLLRHQFLATSPGPQSLIGTATVQSMYRGQRSDCSPTTHPPPTTHQELYFIKWPLGNSGTTYLRYVTDTVQTVQYSDSQCAVQVYTQLPPRQPPTSRTLSTIVLLILETKFHVCSTISSGIFWMVGDDPWDAA